MSQRNKTARQWFSRDEMEKAGHGTKRIRLGADSMREHDTCNLCLQPATSPVCTPQGTLFCRECILRNLLEQKRTIKSQLAAWEAQEAARKADEAEAADEAKERRVRAFESRELSVLAKTKTEAAEAATRERARRKEEELAVNSVGAAKMRKEVGDLQCYWLPEMAPDSAPARVGKPKRKPTCPVTGAPLRKKELVAMEFTSVEGAGKLSEGRHMCGVCSSVITRNTRLVVVRPSRRVVCASCADKFVRPEMVCYFTSAKLKEGDLVAVERAGTGFAGRDGKKLKAEKYSAPMGFG